MDFQKLEEISMGNPMPISMVLQKEERINHEKTQQLMKHLKEIEQKSIQMRMETERLRNLKDEAKKKVKENFPHIFKSNFHDIENENNADSIRFTEDELEISDTSVSSGDITRSEGDETTSRFGARHRFSHFPQNANHMSKEVQELYTKLVASNNFDANLSDSSDLDGPKKIKKRISSLKNHKVAWGEQERLRQDELHTSALGNMLRQFDQQHLLKDDSQKRPTIHNISITPTVKYNF